MTFTGSDPRTARRRLYGLLDMLKSGRLDVGAFCAQFETTYNLELDKKELTPAETFAFGMLFEKVVWYSPYPEERSSMPHDLGESDILAAVADVERILAQAPSAS